MLSIPCRKTTHPKPLPPTSELKFGRHFSDHWFMAKYQEGKGWFETLIEPYGKVALDPAASVLHYGQALFEGMKAFRQGDGSIALFRPDFNWNRLKAGGARLCMEAPDRELFMQSLKDLITLDERWVPKDESCSLYIRPTLIGTEGFLGVRPAQNLLYFVILSPVGPYYARGQEPTRIWVEDSAVRAAPGGLGATKAGANYAAGLQSGFLAKQKGYDQVLWLDVNHQGVEEVGTMNVFWVFKNEIVTPALNGSILAGGMRDSVVQLLKHKKQPVFERRITMDEIIQRIGRGELVEAFGTGTAAVISPIGDLHYKGKNHVICDGKTGPMSQALYHEISAIQHGRADDVFGWMKPLKTLA